MSEQLVRVIAKWLGQVHCPSASHSLSRSVGCVVDLPDAAPGGNELSGWTVDVETLSGVQLGTFKGLDPSNTVHELQVRIAERLGHEKFPVHQQYLFLTGSASELSANATLQQCGVVDGATLVLVLRLNLEWDPQKSNSYLEFSDDNRTVTRPGSVSSYPCARTKFVLQGPGESFCVRIKALPPENNGFTIGVLRASGEMKNARSTGVGCCADTMGVYIANVRARFATPQTRRQCIRYNYEFTGPWLLMFKESDTLRFRLHRNKADDNSSLCLDFIFNDKHVHRAPLPAHFDLPLQPLCTLPDNCCLELIP
eukprot:INCI14333.1.p1 GENE.INCI14333.1~~INCI14333.1.p1  ORF type:complete len:311 (-),score=36.51 INCI14333.1:383-1315(-)